LTKKTFVLFRHIQKKMSRKRVFVTVSDSDDDLENEQKHEEVQDLFERVQETFLSPLSAAIVDPRAAEPSEEEIARFIAELSKRPDKKSYDTAKKHLDHMRDVVNKKLSDLAAIPKTSPKSKPADFEKVKKRYEMVQSSSKDMLEDFAKAIQAFRVAERELRATSKYVRALRELCARMSAEQTGPAANPAVKAEPQPEPSQAAWSSSSASKRAVQTPPPKRAALAPATPPAEEKKKAKSKKSAARSPSPPPKRAAPAPAPPPVEEKKAKSKGAARKSKVDEDDSNSDKSARGLLVKALNNLNLRIKWAEKPAKEHHWAVDHDYEAVMAKDSKEIKQAKREAEEATKKALNKAIKRRGNARTMLKKLGDLEDKDLTADQIAEVEAMRSDIRELKRNLGKKVMAREMATQEYYDHKEWHKDDKPPPKKRPADAEVDTSLSKLRERKKPVDYRDEGEDEEDEGEGDEGEEEEFIPEDEGDDGDDGDDGYVSDDKRTRKKPRRIELFRKRRS